MIAFAMACIFFVDATGFTSQRYEVDFLVFLVFIGCVVACELLALSRKWPRTLATTAVVQSIGAFSTRSGTLNFAFRAPSIFSSPSKAEQEPPDIDWRVRFSLLCRWPNEVGFGNFGPIVGTANS